MMRFARGMRCVCAGAVILQADMPLQTYRSHLALQFLYAGRIFAPTLNFHAPNQYHRQVLFLQRFVQLVLNRQGVKGAHSVSQSSAPPVSQAGAWDTGKAGAWGTGKAGAWDKGRDTARTGGFYPLGLFSKAEGGVIHLQRRAAAAQNDPAALGRRKALLDSTPLIHAQAFALKSAGAIDAAKRSGALQLRGSMRVPTRCVTVIKLSEVKPLVHRWMRYAYPPYKNHNHVEGVSVRASTQALLLERLSNRERFYDQPGRLFRSFFDRTLLSVAEGLWIKATALQAASRVPKLQQGRRLLAPNAPLTQALSQRDSAIQGLRYATFKVRPDNERSLTVMAHESPLKMKVLAPDGSLTPALSRRERGIQSVRLATFTVTVRPESFVYAQESPFGDAQENLVEGRTVNPFRVRQALKQQRLRWMRGRLSTLHHDHLSRMDRRSASTDAPKALLLGNAMPPSGGAYIAHHEPLNFNMSRLRCVVPAAPGDRNRLLDSTALDGSRSSFWMRRGGFNRPGRMSLRRPGVLFSAKARGIKPARVWATGAAWLSKRQVDPARAPVRNAFELPLQRVSAQTLGWQSGQPSPSTSTSLQPYRVAAGSPRIFREASTEARLQKTLTRQVEQRLQQVVQGHERKVQTQVVQQIVQGGETREQIRKLMAESILSPTMLHSLTERLVLALEKRNAIERYRKGG